MSNQPNLSDECVLSWLQETPGLRSADIAARAKMPTRYIYWRMSVLSKRDLVQSREDRAANGRVCTYWYLSGPETIVQSALASRPALQVAWGPFVQLEQTT